MCDLFVAIVVRNKQNMRREKEKEKRRERKKRKKVRRKEAKMIALLSFSHTKYSQFSR